MTICTISPSSLPSFSKTNIDCDLRDMSDQLKIVFVLRYFVATEYAVGNELFVRGHKM